MTAERIKEVCSFILSLNIWSLRRSIQGVIGQCSDVDESRTLFLKRRNSRCLPSILGRAAELQPALPDVVHFPEIIARRKVCYSRLVLLPSSLKNLQAASSELCSTGTCPCTSLYSFKAIIVTLRDTNATVS
ncbi:hypothetical protein BT96DRAFT_404982 [Gymnopus androsaceus JB14]|uniref:Uncharacterized protein n=1 Tax=Gymnopus androsaceus JB14 TaxID=1447944 RepID=A0A6A4I7S9_9AGAR|nr:hypothetical protein BT96DRAFT_404982 [Gymnopus androsaceus JB14]